MPQFETEYEKKLYEDRVASLNRIADVGQRLGLSQAEATYPNSFAFEPEGVTLAKIREQYEETSGEELEREQPAFAIAGRLMAIRSQGKAGFAQLQQGGERLQIYVRKDDVGEDLFELYKELHIGDHIGVRGRLMRTRTGELTLKVEPVGGRQALVFLAKAMLALPDKYHGLEDVELRYRQRYVDLIMNSGQRPQQEQTTKPAELPPGTSAVTDTAAPNAEHEDAPRNVREVFEKRAKVLRAIRKFFDDREYIEVETPMLHPVVGGAAARPFTTHHNALDIPLFLRIAPELYLKRLVVGGLDRVYEINRNFRNEGVSTRHNPEFTMLEFYQAYANYHDLMELTEELIKFVAKEVNGSYIAHFNGRHIDLSQWTRLSMKEAITRDCQRATDEIFSNSESMLEFLDTEAVSFDRQEQDAIASGVSFQYKFDTFDPNSAESEPYEKEQLLWLIDRTITEGLRARRKASELRAAAQEVRAGGAIGKAITAIFELFSEPHLIQPTIIYDFPLAVSPLSKVKPDDPDWVERFEFYIGGFEVGNAFSELNDAADQEARFKAQVSAKQSGDEEAMGEVDEDYVRALGYGLPPTAGEGIGIDRLTMVLTGSRSIRDVILFPLMRPQGRTGETPAPAEEHTHGESAE